MLPSLDYERDFSRRLNRRRGGFLARRSGLLVGAATTVYVLTVGSATLTFAQSMHEALVAALAKSAEMPPDDGAVTGQWLSAPPTLAASYLGSNETQGTDETEISLNFPLKSPRQRRSDTTLLNAEPALHAALNRYRAWYLSGVLRQLYSDHAVAEAQISLLERKAAIFDEVRKQLQQRVMAGSAERFELIALQRAGLDVSEQLTGLYQRRDNALEQFTVLTGFQQFPATTLAPLPVDLDYANHPQLQWLELNYERDLADARSSSQDNTPWNVAIVGRELDSPALQERQVGIAVEVPLQLGGRARSIQTQSLLRALHREFLQQRDQLQQDLRRQWNNEQTTLYALRERQRQTENLFNPDDLEALLKATRKSNELPIEIKVSRLAALLQSATEASLVSARIAAVEARIRQLSGELL